MQPVRKKASHSRHWLFIALIVLLIFALGLILIFQLNSPRKSILKSDHHPVDIILVDKDASQVLSMRIQLPGETPYTLLRAESGFVVQGLSDFQLDQAEVAMMASNVSKVVAEEALGEMDTNPENLAAFGLSDQVIQVDAGYTDGETKLFLLGKNTGAEIPTDYLMVSGDRQVYTISASMKSMFDRQLNTLHTLPRIDFNSKLLDRVRIKGQEDFILSQQEGLWEITSPIRYPADEMMARQLLEGIGKMRLAVYVGKETAKHLQEYGFSDQSTSISFDLASSVITALDDKGQVVQSQDVPAQTIQLTFGHQIGNIGFYCLYDGSIYQASLASMGFLKELSLHNALSTSPVNIPINRLTQLRVSGNGTETNYDIELVEKILQNNALAVDEQGNQLYEPDVSKNGVSIPSEDFLREYIKLMGIRASGSLPKDFIPENNPLITFTFKQKESQTELALFPFDALHYAMRVNGVFFHYVPKDVIDQIKL